MTSNGQKIHNDLQVFQMVLFIALLITQTKTQTCPNCIGMCFANSCSGSCISGYQKVPVGNLQTCQIIIICTSPCSTCSPTATDCTGCVVNYNLAGSTCVLTCQSPCTTCTGTATTCTGCISGKYLSGSTCLPCTAPCANCSGSATQCQSCVDTSKMAVVSQQCRCTSFSEYMNVSTCSPCNSPCTTCTGATTCTGCISGKYLSGNSCLSCTPPCANCSGSATQCQSCVDTSKMAVVSQQCHCTSSSEYMNGSTCSPCNSPCTSCTGATTCTGCISGKYLSGNSCLSCTPPCANCSGQATQCQSCVDTSKMAVVSQQCHCTSSSEYMNGSTCSPCNSPCTSCTGATTCTGCISGKYLSGNSCLSCTPPCANCSGSATQCQSCVDTSKMAVVSQQCHCTSSSEYMNVSTCSPCNSPCTSCTGATTCTGCISGKYLSGTSCLPCTSPCTSCTGTATTCLGCIGGKYLSGNTCYDCSPPCANCVTTSTTCQSCTDSSNMTFGSNTCTCTNNAKYFNGTVCQSCTSPCFSCITSDTHCTSCQDSTHMTNSSNICTCSQSNYFFNFTTNTCQICTSPCKTCVTSASNCTTCIDGNYLDGNLCPLCDPPCQKCVTTSSTCTYCMDNTNMQLLTNQCSCTNPQYYFDESESICKPCSLPCYSCLTSAVHCLTCMDQPHQTINASFECICNDINAFFNGLICLSCTLPCYTCLNTATYCLSCLDILQDNSINKCLCPDGYFEDSTHYCSLCQPPCVNCVTLNQCISCINGWYIHGFDCLQCVEPCNECEFATLCLNCIDSFMIVNQEQKCICHDGYFMSGISCFPCQSPCLNCENYPNQCTSCLENFNLENETCVCQEFTYLQIYPENICLRCQLPCLECELAVDYCDLCSDAHHNLINHKCICSYGYGTSGPINESCDLCIYPCATCSISINYCQSCMDGGFQLVDGQCICQDGYYEQNQQCWKCKNQCKRCINTADNCLECADLNFIISQGKCQCKYPGYLEIVGECKKCHAPCLNCFAQVDLCTSCIKPHQLAVKYECVCVDGYYMDQNQDCQHCPLECATCLKKYICLTCIGGYYLENYKCVKCFEPCQQCTNMHSCITCVDEYYSFEDKCLGCPYKCKTCVDSYTCVFCSDGYYLLNNQCLQCSDECGTCIDSYYNCTACIDVNQIVFEGKCICKEKYFEEENSCKQCPSLCLQCTSYYYCQECIIGAEIILEDNQCRCQIGHFLTDQNECIECSSKCKSCVLDANHCQSCSAQRELSDQKCICRNGYYENDKEECEDCNSEIGHLIEICQYENSIDGIWTWGEQCDDGNQILRDGCSNNQIDSDFKCLNVLSQQSYCVEGPEHCQTWEIIEIGKIDCSECQQGYFMDYEPNNPQNKICVKCSDRCLECKDASINCTQCRFISIADQCRLCEQQQGKYSNYQTNECYSTCGDSFLAPNEECDDGNKLDHDGCSSSCLLETGYECFGQHCSLIQYPLPLLTQISRNIYNNSRSFLLEFDQLLSLKSNYFIEDLIQIDVGGQLNLSYFVIYLNQTRQIEQTNLTNLTVEIDIYFNNSCQSQQLVINFIQMDLITNRFGQQIQVNNISVNVDDYYKLEPLTIIATQYSISFNNYILICLCILAVISVLFGGLEIFYNLMDTLQLISYLQYVNTNFPYNFETFLSLYQFAQLRFLENFINVEQYIDGMIPESYLNSLPSKFRDDDLTPLFLINGSSILSVWASCLGVFYLTKIAPFFLNLITTEVYYFDKGIRLTFKIMIVKLKLHFLQISKSVQATFFFSGLIRTHMSTAYDFSFALVLNLYSLDLLSSNLLIQISSALTLASFLMYMSIILFSTIFTDLNDISLKTRKIQDLCGTIFEGLRLTGYSKYYNTFLLIKKLIFMVILVFPYKEPLYQIMNLLTLSIINSVFLMVCRPLKETSEFQKQITCEIFLAVTYSLIFVLAIDDIVQVFNQNGRLLLGWCTIASISAILCIQLVIDSMQQWRYILKNYRSVRKIVNHLKKMWLNFQPPPPQPAEALIFY